MKVSSITLAAALLAAGLASTAEAAMSVRAAGAASIVHKACYECEDYLEAVYEAREEAREAAAERAEERAEEAEEYGYSRPSAGRRQRVMPTARLEKPAPVASQAKPAKDESAKAEPAKTEAAKTSAKSDVAVNAPTNCKQYSPATGLLLSVPCE
ncbi:MAG TPA: hypothetical protein VH852_02285 [Hyphomicrobium sp.]|jgi:hypothetical protein